MANTGMEYTKRGRETLFETFQRYTDEKMRTSIVLAEIIREVQPKKLLDIGAGNGGLLKQALTKADAHWNIDLTLIEPSNDFLAGLSSTFAGPKNQIIHSDLASYYTVEKFDLVIAAHLFYHIPRSEWSQNLRKISSFLAPGGKLVTVLRGKDDVYDFKAKFKPLVGFEKFQPASIDQIVPDLENIGLKVDVHNSQSSIHFPFDESNEDAISIIEFYLNTTWEDITHKVRQSILRYIENRNNCFKIIDGIAIAQF